jgi:tRNA threonylcarbamoyl adenosine modification protein YeaZ
MKILAWDTSSKTGALVAMVSHPDGPKLLTELTLNVDATHSERLLWGIHQILESAHWRLEDVDVFGVGVGPGSFTGLRIGITTARTLAHTFKKPLVGVSSLAALARPVALQYGLDPDSTGHSTLVIASTDACKGELFALWGEAQNVSLCASVPDSENAGEWHVAVNETVLEPEQLVRVIQEKLAAAKNPIRWIVVGEGRHRYRSAWDQLPRDSEIQHALPFVDHVQGRYLGLLVNDAWQENREHLALGVFPRYIRASDAELKLKAGLLPKGPSRGLVGS